MVELWSKDKHSRQNTKRFLEKNERKYNLYRNYRVKKRDNGNINVWKIELK